MSWLKLASPKPCAEKQRKVDHIHEAVGVALRDLKRSLIHADASRQWHFDPALAEVNEMLRSR